MKKVDTILLVDDDETTNFFHKHILSCAKIANQILAVTSGEEALSILSDPKKNSGIDLVLLDVKMPVMDGFEFIEFFEKLPATQRVDCKIAMLSTSGQKFDKDRSASNKTICGYYIKPLSRELVEQIYKENF